MDHKEIRKGILQARAIESKSGLLFLEMFAAPFWLAIKAGFFLNPILGTNWSSILTLVIFVGSWFLFRFSLYRRTPLVIMALFFSSIWAYYAWVLFGTDKPLSEYRGLIYMIRDYVASGIPSFLIFCITMHFHRYDFAYLENMTD